MAFFPTGGGASLLLGKGTGFEISHLEFLQSPYRLHKIFTSE
jgi:hypothetical protein